MTYCGRRRAGRRITVHGDYDVDGVCATAILVGALREAGASCDWLIPDRLTDGYGLTRGGVEAIVARGTEVLVTVDCGIACAEEVTMARELGMEVIVTDHHVPPDRLPDCTILHPVVSGYPFEGLCGAGVAHKLAIALRRALGVVPRRRAGPRPGGAGDGRRHGPPGRREPAARARGAGGDAHGRAPRAARADGRGLFDRRAAIDEGALAFRLAPRINAAGRLYRADAGVELMLTEDADRAAAIAAELDRANHERREAEREVMARAEAALAELPDELREAPALVLAGEGWHRGVVGIAASRLVERHWRPVVLIGLDGDRGHGSGRSIPGFDLVEALDACSQHLVRHGGHAAAAGLELEAGRLEAFRRAFAEHASAHLDPEPGAQRAIDALVGSAPAASASSSPSSSSAWGRSARVIRTRAWSCPRRACASPAAGRAR